MYASRHDLACWAIALTLTMAPLSAHAGINTWTPARIWGGQVADLDVDPVQPMTMYAVFANKGARQSVDGGATWSAMATLPNNLDAGAIAISPSDPTTVFLAGFRANAPAVYKSTDRGISWASANTGLNGSFYLDDIAVDPSTSNVVYAAAGFDGVFKSTDGGATWAAASAGIADAVTTIVIDPTDPTTVYASGNKIYRSTDSGASWTHLSSFPSIGGDNLIVQADDPSVLYASGGLTDLVYQSVDAGSTWTALGGSFPAGVETLALDPHDGSLYAGTRQGLFRWSGSVWVYLTPTIEQSVFAAIAFDPSLPDILYAGSAGGVYKSTDAGASWTHASLGLIALGMEAVAIDPIDNNRIYAASNGGITRSTDGGAIWSPIAERAANTAIVIDPLVPTTVYSAGYFGGIDKSLDAGLTWSPVNSGLGIAPQFGALAMDPVNPSILYGGLVFDKGLFKTTDGGLSWTSIEGALAGNDYLAIAVAPSAPATVYLGTADQGVFRSSDGGATWIAASTGLPVQRQIGALAVNPTNPSHVLCGANDTILSGGQLYQTVNAGASWSAGPLTGYISAIRWDSSDASRLYVARGGGVARSRNGGATWSTLNVGLTDQFVTDLAIDPIDPRRLVATTLSLAPIIPTGDGGIWSIDQRCGDGVVDAGEACDDGNLIAGDCCSPECAAEPVFSPCGAGATACSGPDSCDGLGACLARDLVAGAPCGDAGTDCRPQDTCDGAGTCIDNGVATAGAPCGDFGTDCRNQDTCDGSGTCLDNGFVAAGTNCGSGADTCSAQDTCNGSGSCLPNNLPDGLPCGAGATVCSGADSCSGGVCVPNDSSAGIACPDDGDPCTPDECDGSGSCAHLDVDADGIGDRCDNCAAAFNPDQANADCGDPGFFASGACTLAPPDEMAGCCDGGDVCDPCPARRDNSSCETIAVSVGTAGETIELTDGSAEIVIPPGAVSAPTSISASTSDPEGTFSVATASASVKSISLRPENAAFLVPVSITFQWDDRDDDGIVDSGSCLAGGDVGQSCDGDADCPGGTCSASSGPDESGLVLKRNGQRFGAQGFDATSFRCDEHAAGICTAAVANCSDPAGTGLATVAGCCNQENNTWTFQTCYFSEFYLGLTAGDLIPGKGKAESDCMAEWSVRNPLNDPRLDRRGLPNFKQACTDGDATCDTDGLANGSCEIEVSLCLNVTDPRLVDVNGAAACTPTTVDQWIIKKPLPTSTKPFEAPNAIALRDAVAALAASSVGGPRQERVNFSTPLATGDLCTAPVRVKVPLLDGTRKGKAVLKMQTIVGTERDTDKVKLTCLPSITP